MLHERWLAEQEQLLAILDDLAGLVLGCWCAPRACHCDVYVRLANASPEYRRVWRERIRQRRPLLLP